MKLVKNRKFAQRGNLLMQSAVALLIGALSVAGVIYFLGYINSAKTQAAVEQLQGLSIATINESSRSTPDTTFTAFVNSNNFVQGEWSNIQPTAGGFNLVNGATLNFSISDENFNDTSKGIYSAIPGFPSADIAKSTAQVLVKALNAGFIYPTTSFHTIETDPVQINGIFLNFIKYDSSTAKYTVNNDSTLDWTSFGASGGILLGNFAKDASSN